METPRWTGPDIPEPRSPPRGSADTMRRIEGTLGGGWGLKWFLLSWWEKYYLHMSGNHEKWEKFLLKNPFLEYVSFIIRHLWFFFLVGLIISVLALSLSRSTSLCPRLAVLWSIIFVWREFRRRTNIWPRSQRMASSRRTRSFGSGTLNNVNPTVFRNSMIKVNLPNFHFFFGDPRSSFSVLRAVKTVIGWVFESSKNSTRSSHGLDRTRITCRYHFIVFYRVDYLF